MAPLIPIAGGIVAVTLIWKVRQHSVRQDFLQKHGEEIEAQNKEAVERWRRTNDGHDRLVIEREFRPPVLLAPKVRIRRKYRRDTRSWFERVFG